MFLVCEKCKKVLVDGKWVDGIPPIGRVSYTLCPACEPAGEHSSHDGMVYMDQKRAQGKRDKNKGEQTNGRREKEQCFRYETLLKSS